MDYLINHDLPMISPHPIPTKACPADVIVPAPIDSPNMVLETPPREMGEFWGLVYDL